MKKFNFIDLDKSKLPVTKGKKVDGFRFYDIDGKAPIHLSLVYWVSKRNQNYKVGVRRLVKMLPIGKWVEPQDVVKPHTYL